MGNKEIADDWIAENRVFIDNWIAAALEGFWNDTSVRVPRTAEGRQNGLEAWLESFRLKMRSNFEQEFHLQFASLSALLSKTYIADVFDQNAWPQIKPDIQRYAIYGFAAAWVGRHLGDATTIGIPKLEGQQWRVPLSIRGHGENLGQVTLNLDGEVLPELTTTRSSLLEAICEPSLPALAAASR